MTGRTLRCTISETAIRRHAKDPEIRELFDQGRRMRLRFRRDRLTASWWMVLYRGGKADWVRAGVWPDVQLPALLKELPAMRARLSADPQASVAAVSGWSTCGDLIRWHRKRTLADRSLSKSRVAGIRSAIDQHLLPRLEDLPLEDLGRDSLDQRLVWPLQAWLALSTVRMVLQVLKAATRRAWRLKLLPADPLAGVTFTDFTDAPILARPGALSTYQAASVLAAMRGASPVARTYLMLLLCHGTRRSETRLARWRDIDWEGGEWHLPAANVKTRSAHCLPLTPAVQAWLADYHSWLRATGYRGDCLFPSIRRPAQAMGKRQAGELVRSVSAGEWAAHDLRKLMRTALTDLGVEHWVGERLINHAVRGLDATYIHTQARHLMRAALETYHDWLAERGGLVLTPRHDQDANHSHADAAQGAMRAAGE